MEDQNNETVETRDGKGRYTRNITTVERDAQAARLHANGLNFRQIAAELGIGVGTAYQAVERAKDHVIREPAEAAILASLRNLAEERARLLDLRASIEKLLDNGHVTVSQGRVVYDDTTGTAVPDDEFTLKVADRLMKLDEQLRRNDESRRRLEGLDQPAKTNISGGVTYEIIGITQADLT